MKDEREGKAVEAISLLGGLAGSLLRPLLNRLRSVPRPQPRLELLERISIAPRQTLSLVEAEGRRFLVATSAEGGPAFYALDERARPETGSAAHRAAKQESARISW